MHYIFYDDIKKTGVAGAGTGTIKDYARFDTQVSYEPADGITFSLIGQNLLDSQHQEYIRASYNNTSEVPRSVFGKATLRF
jgi:iron complex outermembrane recepter protein